MRSSNPHPISINLRKLQEILDPNKIMDLDVFNLGVRLIACDEAAVSLTRSEVFRMLFNLLVLLLLLHN
jgi:hypothetical protein